MKWKWQAAGVSTSHVRPPQARRGARGAYCSSLSYRNHALALHTFATSTARRARSLLHSFVPEKLLAKSNASLASTAFTGGARGAMNANPE